MSLFKAREWWSCQVGTNEKFDYGCLRVGNFIDDQTDKIFVGSQSGILRIYSPSKIESDGNQSSRPSDLLYEKYFNSPIVQIEIGNFVGNSNEKQIAILFSQKLSVFDYHEQSGTIEQGLQVGLQLNYEHNLNRPTFNMCKGHFGGRQKSKSGEENEYLCVQTLDGVLFVFEHERQSMAKSLPNTFLPGPLAYLSRFDGFLTVSSNFHLECYKYQTLAISSGAETGSSLNAESRRKAMDDDSGLSSSQSGSRRVAPEWSFNLGETALAIQVTPRPRNSPQTIIVLGERNLFAFNDNGQLIYMTKFEFSPSSCLLYGTENQLAPVQGETQNPNVRYIIGTHSHTLFICQDGHIRWAAHVDAIPVQIETCTLKGIRGMICTLSENGFLQCCYLGTDPVSNSIPTLAPSTTINVQEAEEQLRKLTNKIKETMNDPSLIVRRKANAQVNIFIDDTNKFSMTNETQFRRGDSESTVPSLTIKVRVKSTETIQNVLLTVNVQSPICVQPAEIRIGTVGGAALIGDGTFSFWMLNDLTPWSLDANFTLSYSTMSDHVIHTIQKSHRLPLKLVARPVQTLSSPNPTGRCQITIGTNKPLVDLNRIFPELSNSDISQQQMLPVRFYGSNQTVYILTSTKSQKYRFQSDSLAHIWLFCQLLVENLKSSPSIDFEYGEPLPYDDYFKLIDQHFEFRAECEQLNSTLDLCSKQFRAIQKRLLNKLKDKTPTLLDNLDILLENTSQQIIALADRYEQCRYELSRCSHDLSCATRLICLLLKLSVNLSEENSRLLNAILSPVLSDDNEQGWEETVEAAVNHALKTTLARSKNVDLGTTSSSMGNSTSSVDLTRFKKRIQTLCERLEKGGSLVSSSSTYQRDSSHDSSNRSTSLSTRKEKPPLTSHKEVEENDESSQIGDRRSFAFLPSDDLGKNRFDDD